MSSSAKVLVGSVIAVHLLLVLAAAIWGSPR
jgi:hypothetical protein